MSTMNLNEQILFLRKQKGLTQEALAKALGVTNQAVSKWEAAQCCPDIQLLPDMAELFQVSVDELLGHAPTSTAEDLVLSLRGKINSLSDDEGFAFAFRMAAALHTIVLSRYMEKALKRSHSWDSEDTLAHAGNGEWGYSCCDAPALTTTMRHGCIFFSNNRDIELTASDIRGLTQVLRAFTDPRNLKVALALHHLTCHSEEAWAAPAQISEKCGLSEEAVCACLNGSLNPFLIENENLSSEFRFEGMYMNLIPILSLLACKG